ncbi:centromere protein L isoform X1 [Artibeus jamaicensis]|uniref:centromere protein L isoform X1 n=1 Tax=Artibeus jamaicensis TaxID=9417 RepID=UPI00235B07A0|nr:centromere protein L isoform X1 [Artibeus jamaicensis]
MDSHSTRRSTPRRRASARLKEYVLGATPLQKRLESARKQTSLAATSPPRRIPQRSQLREDVDPQKVAFLLHRQWTLYSSTPLYKFSYTSLKEYSKLLSAYIAAEKQKGLAVEVGADLNLRVSFSTLQGVKGTHRDPDTVLVQILSKSQLPSESREGKVLWTGWLCCVFGDSLLETVPEDFTCLPLFLTSGAEANTALVGTWFQKTFDCCFSPLAINAFNLSWMAAMWTACQVDRCVAPTEFLWSVPCSPQSLDISYAIHPEDAKALWDGVHKASGEVTQEEVDLFMDCLCSHFHRHFKIHLSATRLVRVSTSVASAHTDGKIKILCHKYLIGVLAYLTELAIFQIE